MKTTIHQVTPNSTAIAKWAFYSDGESGVGTLFVTFQSGSEYAYRECPISLVVPMITQASIGRYFAHTIKKSIPEVNVVNLTVMPLSVPSSLV